MSVYKKLADARVKLQSSGLKKSGLNKFAGYDYFELEDFLPKINEINKEVGLCTIVSFGQEIATLRIVDVDKPEEIIELTSPMAQVELKGCHAIQNLGAVESYQRRYLYMTAYEIAENDMLDATAGKGKPTNGSKTPPDSVGATENKNKGNNIGTISDGQQKRLFALSKGNTELVKKVLMSKGFTKSSEIPKGKVYNDICKEIEENVK
jgi:hypothetical protein